VEPQTEPRDAYEVLRGVVLGVALEIGLAREIELAIDSSTTAKSEVSTADDEPGNDQGDDQTTTSM